MKTRMLVAAVVALGFVTGQTRAGDIVDTAVGAKDFTILVKAVKAAGLVDTLKGKGPFTVFAPTDKAFKKLGNTLNAVVQDKEKLKKILLAHVIVGKSVMAKDAMKLGGEKVNGFMIDTTEGVKIGNAKVIKADIKCDNGVIHVIDTVLIPKE